MASYLLRRCSTSCNLFIASGTAPGRKPAIETTSQRERFVEVHSIQKVQIFYLIPAAGILSGGMAYRGQGQKIQKVMVQPIVSFLLQCPKDAVNRLLH